MSTGDEGLEADIADKPTLKKRFKAWWNGYDLDDGKPQLVLEEAERQQVADDGPPTVKGWSVSRQKSVVTLFGEGMTRCIPDEMKTKMTQPMGINKTMSVSELGGNMAGFSRWVAETYETYVTNYDEDQTLIDAANEMTKMAGLQRNITSVKCDFEDFKPKDRSANVVYSSESLFHVKDKRKCFKAIHRMLRPEGQFMMSDFMLDGMGGEAPELDKWKQNEPSTPHLLDVQETRKLMTDAGFDVSIAENITDEYRLNV
ncbi:MAG: class I SAM-dependent methyltransferase, partial [Sneathiella sp.]|uniref:SAM-dependent methyltransferase n=1 Tax=Sneathiella sp. TaxID=1964365 RepID=UPI003002DBCB